MSAILDSVQFVVRGLGKAKALVITAKFVPSNKHYAGYGVD